MPPELLSLLGILTVILLVMGGAYAFTRWAGKMGGLGGFTGGGRLKVLDRAGLGRDQQLLVVQAGERFFLLGSSPAGLSLLTELSAEEGELWRSPPTDPTRQKPADFRTLLLKIREKNTDEKR